MFRWLQKYSHFLEIIYDLAEAILRPFTRWLKPGDRVEAFVIAVEKAGKELFSIVSRADNMSSTPSFFLGAAANPFVTPYDWRPHRLAKKIAAGAEFIQTQYCFDVPRFREYMGQVRDLGLHRQVRLNIDENRQQ